MIGEEEWLRGQFALELGRTVVLAQTGVTGVQIDNLSLTLLKALFRKHICPRAFLPLFQPVFQIY